MAARRPAPKARSAAAPPVAPGGSAPGAADAGASPAAVAPRSPCPCGSGKRYKSCHGATGRAAGAPVRRPFAGLPSEPDWVQLREVVPAATAPLRLAADGPAGEHADRPVLLCTLLPAALPALVRDDGGVLLGLQVHGRSGDVSRDVAAALEAALAAPGAGPVGGLGLPGLGPRLQELLAPQPLDVTVHDGFGFWLEGREVDPALQAQLEQAGSTAVPTERLASVEAAYWCRMAERAHLRWALPEEEDVALDALARLAAADEGLALRTADGEALGRWVGSFRAHGLLVPVWDLPRDTPASEVEAPAAAFRARLDAALAETGPLPPAARSARPGLQGRQLTLR